MFGLVLNYKFVGKNIKKYRLEMNMTQEKLAEMSNISKNYLSNLELGKAAGRLDKYCRIAQALGVTVDMLIGNISDQVSYDNDLFLNQLAPLISSFPLSKRKILIDFIDMLNNYDIEISDNQKS